MKTKVLMTASGAFMAFIGIGLSFLPDEISEHMGLSHQPLLIILFQAMGALYFGFGLMNYTAKGAIIGGIYNKPIALGNFAHFLIGSLAAVKFIFNNPDQSWSFYILTLLYAVFAVLFARTTFLHPSNPRSES